MSLLDDVMAIHRKQWSAVLQQAQNKIRQNQGKVTDANRVLEDERQAREAIANLIELIEASRRLEAMLPRSLEVADKYLTTDMRSLIWPVFQAEAA
jgi:hypothetical protein